MADTKQGVSKTTTRVTYARNLASQPREFKITGKWYRWNALGTKGDTVDITKIKNRMGNYAQYFYIYEVEK